MALERVIDRMVDMMLVREREGAPGTIVISEGMQNISRKIFCELKG